MAEVGIIWHGMDEFRSDLNQFIGKVPSMLGDATQQAAEMTIEEAQPTVPVLTGRAAGSLMVTKVGVDAAAAVGGDGVEYYGWLEFGGTAGHIEREIIPEGRYLSPAYEKVLNSITEMMDDSIATTLEMCGLVVDNA